MMKFVKKCRQIWVAKRIQDGQKAVDNIGKQLDKMLVTFKDDVDHILETKTFAYTKDLNDTKSDYLKRYLEQRLDCMASSISAMSSSINELSARIDGVERGLEIIRELQD